MGIHDKCLATVTKDGTTLVCGRSLAHAAHPAPLRREHFDASRDTTWDAFGGLGPGDRVASRSGKEYELERYVVRGTGGGLAHWTLKPVGPGRRSRLYESDLEAWQVTRKAGKAVEDPTSR